MGDLLHLPKPIVDQLIKIVVKMLDARVITTEELNFCERLATDLHETLRMSKVTNSFDGFGIGYGECVFWVYTVDLEQTLQEIVPLFKRRFFLPGSYYVKVDKHRDFWDVTSL